MTPSNTVTPTTSISITPTITPTNTVTPTPSSSPPEAQGPQTFVIEIDKGSDTFGNVARAATNTTLSNQTQSSTLSWANAPQGATSLSLIGFSDGGS